MKTGRLLNANLLTVFALQTIACDRITAVCRVGPPKAVYSFAPVITGISIDKPSSGSVQGLTRAIRFHQENGFDQRIKRGCLPLLTVDMGYNVKRHFNDELLAAGYAPVVRYPKSWRTVFASDSAAGTNLPVDLCRSRASFTVLLRVRSQATGKLSDAQWNCLRRTTVLNATMLDSKLYSR